MNEKGRISQIGDFLGQELNAIGRIAKNNALVDLQLVEKRVEAAHLLLLFNKGVKLRDSDKRQLIHQIHNVRIAQMLLLERTHGHRKSGRKKRKLALRVAKSNQLFTNGDKVIRQELKGKKKKKKKKNYLSP